MTMKLFTYVKFVKGELIEKLVKLVCRTDETVNSSRNLSSKTCYKSKNNYIVDLVKDLTH